MSMLALDENITWVPELDRLSLGGGGSHRTENTLGNRKTAHDARIS